MENIKKILLVEDESILRKALRLKLEHENYKVIEAKTGEEAQKILANKVLPDLMILDLMLPGIPGEQVLKEMNDNGLIKKVPVIILTAKGNEANLNNCVEVLGARCYLIKSDHTLDEIVEKIKKNCN